MKAVVDKLKKGECFGAGVSILCSIYWRLVSLPIAALILLVSPIIRIRFISLYSQKIGHFGPNTELMLCAFDLGIFKKHDQKGRVFYFYYTNPMISNIQLYKMWKRILPVLPFPRLISWTDYLLKFFSRSYRNDPCAVAGIHSWGLDDLGLYKKVPTPHLRFTESEERFGKAALKALGIPEGGRYICLTVRDSAYLNKYFPGNTEGENHCRNANVLNYKKAMLFLAEKGYYVIRMGKLVNEKFDVSHRNVIDYANYELRSDFMDIYLMAHCHFFISTSTGLDGVSQIFRRPGLATNIILSELPVWYPYIVFIPKRIRDKTINKILTYRELYEIFCSKGRPRKGEIESKENLEIIENTEDEILAAVQEMESRLNGTWHDSDEDNALQRKFFENYLDLYTQVKTTTAEQVEIRLCRSFLQATRDF